MGYAADNLRQKYTGKERGQESGLEYCASRYYASPMERFGVPTWRPQLVPQTFNPYAYVLNNPLGAVDPTGHISESATYADDLKKQVVQMTVVTNSAATAEVESGHGSYADHGIGPVITDQMSIQAPLEEEHIDVQTTVLEDFIRDTIIDPHMNDGDRMVEGLFIGDAKLAIFGATLGFGGVGAVGEAGEVMEEAGAATEEAAEGGAGSPLLPRGELKPTHTINPKSGPKGRG